jgi:hypothetical protein
VLDGAGADPGEGFPEADCVVVARGAEDDGHFRRLLLVPSSDFSTFVRVSADG